MHRNPELIELAPGDFLCVSERQLGAFFSPETFMFVLHPATRRAARHVARWHGCRFEFNPASGSAVFTKRGRVAGRVLSSIESLTLGCTHLISSVRLAVHQGMERRSSVPSQSAG